MIIKEGVHLADYSTGDPCRTRKTRCDIATQSVCSECLKRDQAASCTIRDKARPNRFVPSYSTLAAR